jgi:RHS repeat-associated protein
VYDANAKTVTFTSPEGKTEVDTLDGKARVVTRDLGGGVAPLHFAFDSLGRLTGISSGAATVQSFAYDAANRLVSSTDGAGHQTMYSSDAADRVTSITTPGGRTYAIGRNSDGLPTTITAPNGDVHTLTYAADDQPTGYTAPGATARQSGAYNAFGDRSGTTLPGGRVVSNHFDAGGRLTGLSFAEAAYTLAYAPGDNSDNVATLSRTPVAAGVTNTVTSTFDGGLVTGRQAAGATTGAFTYGYDPTTLRLADTMLASGTDSVDEARTYNQDLQVTGDGPFGLTRSGSQGAVTTIADSVSTLDLAYDAVGRQSQRTLTVNGISGYHAAVTYDGAGKIVKRVETQLGASHSFDYAYDADGELTQVQRDGVPIEAYSYDTNGNRVSAAVGGQPAQTATYGPGDVLTHAGAAGGATAYQFDADGYLTHRGADAFTYSAEGELLSSTVAADTVTYDYDGLGRRVARTQAGQVTQYLYGNLDHPFQVTASRAPSGELTNYFYDEDGLLYAFQRGGNEFAVATDPVGSPLLVLDSSGAAVDQRVYDGFGNLVSESDPTFELPIGFAGGLADPVTGLVRLGYRDYDPATGRFTARDPLLFGGDGFNLYRYVGNDPVRGTDPTGLHHGPGAGAKGAAAFAEKQGGARYAKAEDFTERVVKGVVDGDGKSTFGDDWKNGAYTAHDIGTHEGVDFFGAVKCMYLKVVNALGGGGGAGSPCNDNNPKCK